MRVLVCGSRHYSDYQRVLQHLQRLDVSLVISGGCRGADTLAIIAAKACGYPFIEYPADWKRFGRSAGPRRNAEMLELGNPDFVIAFHQDLSSSKGTLDMLKRIEQAAIPYVIVN